MPEIIVSRGQKYDRTTGRWLGLAEEGEVTTVDADESVAEAPHADDLDLKALKDIAREVELAGFSTMKRAELVEALVASGHVQASEAEDASDSPA